MRRLLWVFASALVIAAPGPARAQIKDLGAFGPTCPLENPVPAPRSAVRLSLSERVPEHLRVATRLTYAPGLGRRRVLSSRAPWPVGAPTTLAFVGTDPRSLALVDALPAGSGVYLVSMESWVDVRAVQARCPRCVVQPGGDEAAALFGIRHYPALVHWIGRELVVTEGP